MVAVMLCIVLMFFGKQGMVTAGEEAGEEAGSEFETLNATDQKGDLFFIASFISLLGLLIPFLGFNQNTFLCYIFF
jgi:hypothetical protein